MVSWENQSQQISQTDFTEWTFVRRSVTSLVLMGMCSRCYVGNSAPQQVAGPARGCYGRAEHRHVGNKGSCQEDVGSFVKTSQNDRVRRKGRLDRL